MKVVLYARVSLDENANDKRYQEPENQLEPLREYCKSRGFEVKHEYIDKGSGADSNRIQFKEMLKEARQGRFNAIVVWKFDRFSREPLFVVGGRINELRRFRIGLISLTESWLDTTQENPMSDIVLAMISWAGNLEREKISQRTKAGIQRRRNIGQWRGGRPRKHPIIKGGAVNERVESTPSDKGDVLIV